MNETSLYAPVKRFLESLDFVVKGEIGGCDIVALRDGEPPVIVICELKLQFNLLLLLLRLALPPKVRHQSQNHRLNCIMILTIPTRLSCWYFCFYDGGQ